MEGMGRTEQRFEKELTLRASKAALSLRSAAMMVESPASYSEPEWCRHQLERERERERMMKEERIKRDKEERENEDSIFGRK